MRDRVHFETVPALASAAAKRIEPDPTGEELAAAYEQVTVILFRLLFVAYAEDKDLLPSRANDLYEAHSLKRLVIDTVRQELALSGLRRPAHKRGAQAITWNLDNNNLSREGGGRLRLAVPNPIGSAGGTPHMRPAMSVSPFQVGVASLQGSPGVRRTALPVCTRRRR